ncbi:MAG TPA: AAA family ATPase, partial [Streptosporangiaceae bacterium]
MSATATYAADVTSSRHSATIISSSSSGSWSARGSASYGPGSGRPGRNKIADVGRLGENPLLFELLNEMDGLAADNDVTFLLTTNRADLLEEALAARPGRVDHAAELP